MCNVWDLKAELKKSAANLRDLHRRRKPKNLAPGEEQATPGTMYTQSRIHRHMHIAYCELRGRAREQIERPRDSNQANEYMIAKYKELYGTPLHTSTEGSTASV